MSCAYLERESEEYRLGWASWIILLKRGGGEKEWERERVMQNVSILPFDN